MKIIVHCYPHLPSSRLPCGFISDNSMFFPSSFSSFSTSLLSLPQIFWSLSRISALSSCLPYTVSSPLWGDKTKMSSTSEPSDPIFPFPSLISLVVLLLLLLLLLLQRQITVEALRTRFQQIQKAVRDQTSFSFSLPAVLLPYWLLLCFAPLSGFMEEGHVHLPD